MDNLLDPILSHSQAQRLLHMICYPDAASSIDDLDQKSMISRILEVNNCFIRELSFKHITKFALPSEFGTVDSPYVLVGSSIDV